ncbi:porin, partial [Salmonella enterica subsp. enterica serovar Virginia]|nr:porin [Salmonella enterica subsp. enterica serovar Virginia]
PVIQADLKLIYRLARWVPRLLPDGRRLRPTEVVREYEKTLIDAKYDANNVYLAAVYAETRNMSIVENTVTDTVEMANKTQNLEV